MDENRINGNEDRQDELNFVRDDSYREGAENTSEVNFILPEMAVTSKEDIQGGDSTYTDYKNVDSHESTKGDFYKEHKKKKGFFSKAISLVLVLCLMSLSGGLGYGLGNVGNTVAEQGAVNFLEATNQINYTGSSISPGVAIAKKVSPAIVSIVVETVSQTFFGEMAATGVGSGIIFSQDGYIVTNAHVVSGAKTLSVTLADGTEYGGTVIGQDPQTDLAVVKIDGKNLPIAVFGDSTTLEVGELAIAIGTPKGTAFGGSVTQGIISGLNRKISVDDRGMTLIQTDAAINQGNSGGALVNANGEVIGINSSKLIETGTEGMGFAIPISEAKPIIEELITQKKISRPYLGISGGTVVDPEKNQVPAGVFVNSVVPGAGAEQAGITAGDIITKVDGKNVKTIEELQEIVKAHKVGDKVEVVVFGVYNRERTVTVTLQETQG